MRSRGPRRALPDARDAVREGDRPALGDVFGVRAAGAPNAGLDAGLAGNERVRARGSDSKTTRSTSPRSSPSTCERHRRSTRHDDRSTSCSTVSPARRRSAEQRDEQPQAAERADGAGCHHVQATVERRVPRDADGKPAGVRVGSQFATSTNAARPTPSISSASGNRPRLARHEPDRLADERSVAGRRPSAARPRPSIRRTSSASKPTPALNENRRPLTRPADRALRRPRGEPRRRRRVATEPERARQHARSAPGKEAERHRSRDAVQHLVVRPVAAQDVDRLGGRPLALGRAPSRPPAAPVRSTSTPREVPRAPARRPPRRPCSRAG
jgi:hypothetical protein